MAHINNNEVVSLSAMIMSRISKPALLLIKLCSGAIIYFIIRLSFIQKEEGYFDLDSTSLFYLIYTTALVFLVWQINDLCYKYYWNRYKKELFQTKVMLKYQAVVFSIAMLSLIFAMYFLHFHLAVFLGCEWTAPPATLMMEDLGRSIIITLIFNLVYLIVIFKSNKRDADLTEERIKKENLLFKYESLRNQIDPHFLFNSFSVLNTLIQTNSKLATEFLNHLSDLYRYVLDNKDNNLISIEKEMHCVNDYLFLMKIRHEDCIESNCNIDKSALKLKVPTMSLQMLIENAIKHNSFSEKKPLTINISSTNNNYIVVNNIINSRRTSKTSAGIGLKNIQKRYEHYTEQKVIIESKNNNFVVKLPIIPD